MDEFIEKYFSISGRLSQLPYFTRGLQIAILVTLLSLPSIWLFSSGSDLLWWAGLFFAAVCGIILVAGSASLVVRRLHDLGLSGYHAIWIIPLLAIPATNSETYFAIPLIALSAWLTFWPGQKRRTALALSPHA